MERKRPRWDVFAEQHLPRPLIHQPSTRAITAICRACVSGDRVSMRHRNCCCDRATGDDQRESYGDVHVASIAWRGWIRHPAPPSAILTTAEYVRETPNNVGVGTVWAVSASVVTAAFLVTVCVW
jgi:hypothetical protein